MGGPGKQQNSDPAPIAKEQVQNSPATGQAHGTFSEFHESISDAQRTEIGPWLRALQHSVKEARFGVMQGNMEVIVDLLNRMDQLLESAQARFGFVSTPIAIREESEAVVPKLRLERPSAENSLYFQRKTPGFCDGQIWRRQDGTPELRIHAVAEKSVIEVQWYLNGRFERDARLARVDLLRYVQENGLRLVGE
jgi:hypothetical protein